jgi:hypothetical protein
MHDIASPGHADPGLLRRQRPGLAALAGCPDLRLRWRLTVEEDRQLGFRLRRQRWPGGDGDADLSALLRRQPERRGPERVAPASACQSTGAGFLRFTYPAESWSVAATIQVIALPRKLIQYIRQG